MSFLDEYEVRRVWWAPWKFAAYGWGSDAPFGMYIARVNPLLSSRRTCREWIERRQK